MQERTVRFFPNCLLIVLIDYEFHSASEKPVVPYTAITAILSYAGSHTQLCNLSTVNHRSFNCYRSNIHRTHDLDCGMSRARYLPTSHHMLLELFTATIIPYSYIASVVLISQYNVQSVDGVSQYAVPCTLSYVLSQYHVPSCHF